MTASEPHAPRRSSASAAPAFRVLGRATAGAILGALSFLAARTLGLPFALHWYGYDVMWVTAAVAALVFLTRLRALVWIVAGVLTATLAVVAFTPAVERPARALIRSDPITRPLDAVVVLSSGVNDDSLVSPEAVDRLLSGIALARDSNVASPATSLPIVLTTVIRRSGAQASSTADQRKLMQLIAPGVRLYQTEAVNVTHDEAVRVRALATREHWSRIAVVTSPLHTRRACAAFERVGLTVVCVPSSSRELAVRSLRRADDRILAFQLWIYEVVGTLYYRLRGWIA